MTHLHQVCAFQKGVVLPLPQWGVPAEVRAQLVIPLMRDMFLEDAKDPMNFQGEIFVGSRTMSNEHVLMRIKANVTEQYFLQYPYSCCYEALHACAEADWYYIEHGTEQP